MNMLDSEQRTLAMTFALYLGFAQTLQKEGLIPPNINLEGYFMTANYRRIPLDRALRALLDRGVTQSRTQ